MSILNNSIIMKAWKNIKTPSVPIWLLRQAGRYMQSYRIIKEKYSFMQLCKNPELSAEITLQPINKFNLDAAIIFSDILLLAEAMGTKVHFDENTSAPSIYDPIKDSKDIETLKVPEPESDLFFILDAIKIVRKTLKPNIPLIGFSGSPWTLAAFMINGNSNQKFIKAKKLLYQHPFLFHKLLEKITNAVIEFLKAQIIAGANAIQIFDSLALYLNKADFLTFSLSYIRKIILQIKEFNPSIPIIIFAKGAHHSLNEIKESGCDVINLDPILSIGDSIKIIKNKVSLQGNLDPAILLCDKKIIAEKVKKILYEAKKAKGYVFNLGDGILKTTPEDNVSFLVEYVHSAVR